MHIFCIAVAETERGLVEAGSLQWKGLPYNDLVYQMTGYGLPILESASEKCKGRKPSGLRVSHISIFCFKILPFAERTLGSCTP
jgi:hypothetical protein